jgi:hypothetical protein
MIFIDDISRDLGTSQPAAANRGLLRPLFIYLGSIALGLVLHVVWPARLVPLSVGSPIGAMVMLGPPVAVGVLPKQRLCC